MAENKNSRILDLREVPDFLPTLAQWHQHEWSYLNPGEDLRGRIARMQQYLGAGFVPSTYVAIGRQLLGSAAIVAHDMELHQEWTPWLASVFVAPAFRRQGIAQALIAHVISEAARHGFDRIYLFTPNHADYYGRLGWERMEALEYRGADVTIMSIATHHTRGSAGHA